MNIIWKPINEVTPYEKNPRIHSETTIARIAKSIKDFGWTQPIVIDGKNIILAGHGRHLAALSLNMVQVPCVLVDDLSEAQKKAYRIIDNKLVTDSAWDDELLQQELNDLVDLDFKVDDFGLDDLHGDKVLDETDEWKDMPEFEQDNQIAPYSVKVHFRTIEDLNKFADIIQQRITENTKYIYFPEQTSTNLKNLNYIDLENETKIPNLHNK
jgi:ParB family chromosome partitioning protein